MRNFEWRFAQHTFLIYVLNDRIEVLAEGLPRHTERPTQGIDVRNLDAVGESRCGQGERGDANECLDSGAHANRSSLVGRRDENNYSMPTYLSTFARRRYNDADSPASQMRAAK